MTNRGKYFTHMGEYDLLTLILKVSKQCPLALIDKTMSDTQWCVDYNGKCEECIGDWLNREAEYNGRISRS